MKPQYAALAKQVDELAVKIGHKQRPWLRIIIVEGEDARPAIERALAAWQAPHPRAKKRTVDDFDWIIRLVAKSWAVSPDIRPPGPASSNNFDVFADEEERKRQFRRRLHYPKSGLA